MQDAASGTDDRVIKTREGQLRDQTPLGIPMSEGLHLVRWLAALLVILAHARLLTGYSTEPIFTFFARHAHAAVMVFFVLSGYVIAATTETKRTHGYTLRDYFLDRSSRIYSVLLPALALTIVLDAVGAAMMPEHYARLPVSSYLVRLLANLFSLQGFWGFRIQFGSNPPLWSIGYEVCYYALFGLFVWRPKHWLLFSSAIAIFVGPVVVGYGVIWFFGALAYRFRVRVPLIVALPLVAIADYFLEYQPVELPLYVRDVMFGFAATALVCAQIRVRASLQELNRSMADFSYSLYAYHFPLMFFVAPFINWTGTAKAIALVTIAVIASRLLYEVTEKQRALLRRGIDVLLIKVLDGAKSRQNDIGQRKSIELNAVTTDTLQPESKQ
jgi:peptidoglycan/LPS O-acetylase OafA/YrhL